MSDGIGPLPSLAGGDLGLSPMLQAWLQDQALAQMQAQPQPQPQGVGGQSVALPQISVDVPPATPPGFTGYDPQTPPTGAPTPVMNPNAGANGSALMAALGPSGAQAGEASQGVSGYTSRVVGVESNGNDFAKNPRSSATGAGQFIDSTWLDQVRKNRPDLASLPDSRILAMRSDPVLSRQMVEAYGNENGSKLRAAGLPDNDGTRYLSHFLGSGGARSVLSADPSTPIGRVLGASQIAANPHIRNMTAGGVANWAAQKMGGGSGLSAGGGGMTPGTAAPNAASMGSTVQAGAFGLSGVAGRGAPVPGQSSPTPGLASLSGQPLAAGALPGGFSTDAAGSGQPAATSPYSNLLGQLQGAAGSLGKGGQQQGQRGQGGGMSMGGGDGGGRPIGLQQAKAMFDPSRFFQMLRAHGVAQPGR